MFPFAPRPVQTVTVLHLANEIVLQTGLNALAWARRHTWRPTFPRTEPRPSSR
jgi:hypothetical protein